MARGTEKGMIIYQELVEIKGITAPFQKICRFHKNHGMFTMEYPKKAFKGKNEIVEMGRIEHCSFNEVEKRWSQHVKDFEALSTTYTLEIRFKTGERTAVYGTNISFDLQWGVFRRVERKEFGDWFMFERGYDIENRYQPSNDVARWNSIPYSAEAEQFFRALSDNICDMHNRLSAFLKQPFDIAKAQKLLKQ